MLNDVLTPEQKTSAAETMASAEMNQVSPLLQLSDSQKDQIYSALYQVQMNAQDPTWIKNNVASNSGHPRYAKGDDAKIRDSGDGRDRGRLGGGGRALELGWLFGPQALR